MAESNKCAHPACNCPSTQGGAYCIPYCKDASDTLALPKREPLEYYWLWRVPPSIPGCLRSLPASSDRCYPRCRLFRPESPQPAASERLRQDGNESASEAWFVH